MAKLLKLRRGTTTQHASFTGAEGEVTIDTDKDTAVVHDGTTQAGRPLAREDMTNVSSASIAGRLGTDSIATTKIAAGALPTDVTVADANISGNLTIESADIVDGTIVNADVNAAAAIAGTKIAPSFGAQDIVGQKLEIDHATPTIELNASSANDWSIINNAGTIGLYDQANGAYRLTIGSDGHLVLAEDKRLSLHSNAFISTKEGATNAVVNNLTGYIVQDSLVLDSNQDIWVKAAGGNKVSFGTSDGATHEVMRVQYDAVGASQHGYVNLNYVTANAGQNASSALKLQTTSTGISVTGNVAATGDILISSANPKISLTDTGQNPDFDILNTNGNFQVNDTTNGSVRFQINSDGHTDFSGNVDCLAGIDVTGNITAGDNDKIQLGASQDFQLLHDGTDNVLDSTGGQSIRLVNHLAGGNETMGKFIPNGAAELYHNGIKTFETENDGIAVIGPEGGGAFVSFKSDEGDDDADLFNVGCYDGGPFKIQNKKSGSWEDSLVITGDAGGVDLYYDNSKKLETTNTGVSVTGDLVASGNVTAYSDARLKTDIHTINDALGTVGKLRGVNYKWLKDGKQSTGLIAQEVEAVIPEVVITNEDLTVDGAKEVKSIDYGKLVGVLIEAVKELKAEVEELKGGK